MHRLSASFVLGYHGCDRHIAESILDGEPFKPSRNDYDWLGHGIYFWEANPARGLDFIKEVQKRREGKPNAIKEPVVIGAVIDLGYCLDLISTNGIKVLKPVYDSLVRRFRTAGEELPKNHGGADLLRRGLDCEVINHLHYLQNRADNPPFDTVRGVFVEGNDIYDNSGFREKTHIQICVRNPDCIKGVFKVSQKHIDETSSG